MHLKRAVAAVLFVLSAPAVFGGVFYRLETVEAGGSRIEETVSVEGATMRIDLVSGDPRDRSCAVITDHGRRVRIFSPDKWYMDAPSDAFSPGVQGPVGGAERFTKSAVTVRTPAGTRTIAGYVAHHVIIEASWVVEIDDAGHLMTVPIGVTWDLWKTSQLSSSLEAPVSQLIARTGNPQVDKLLAAHREAVEGFALSGSMTHRKGQWSETITTTISDIDARRVFAPNFVSGPTGYVEVKFPGGGH